MTTVRQLTVTQQIEKHLSRVYKLQPRMYLNLCDDQSIEANRVVYSNERPGVLILRVPETKLGQNDVLAISYFMDNCPHTFQAKIVECKNTSLGWMFLTMNRPEIIRIVNRRSSVRLSPEQNEPLEISVYGKGNQSYSYKVQDISAGGLSVCVPKEVKIFCEQSSTPIRLSLPGVGIVPARITPRSIQELNQIRRIGAQFTSISEESQLKISQYIIRQILRRGTIERQANASATFVICLIGFSSQLEAFKFLKPQYRVLQFSLKSDLKKLINTRPDVLIIDKQPELPQRAVASIKQLPNLINVPTIVVADKSEFTQSVDAVIIQDLADPAVLVDTIESILLDRAEPNLEPGVMSKAPEVAAAAK